MAGKQSPAEGTHIVFQGREGNGEPCGHWRDHREQKKTLQGQQGCSDVGLTEAKRHPESFNWRVSRYARWKDK